MPKIYNFILDVSLCRPHSEINEIFSKAPLHRWKDVCGFAKSVYTKDPTKTARQVFEDYFQSLVNIAKIKDINSEVVEHASTICKQIVVCFLLSIASMTMISKFYLISFYTLMILSEIRIFKNHWRYSPGSGKSRC